MSMFNDVEYLMEQAREEQQRGNIEGCTQFYNDALNLIDEKLKQNPSKHEEKMINHYKDGVMREFKTISKTNKAMERSVVLRNRCMANVERTIGMNPINNTLLHPTIQAATHQEKVSSPHVTPVQPVTQPAPQPYYPPQQVPQQYAANPNPFPQVSQQQHSPSPLPAMNRYEEYAYQNQYPNPQYGLPQMG